MLVERIVLVDPTTPDANHVDVRGLGLLQALAIPISRDPRWEDVVGDPVDAASEKLAIR
jgi:hypothetical protein